jgi:DNA-binding transcriptional LysR family regulator
MRLYAARAYLKRKGTPRTLEALTRHERIELALHGRPLPWRLREHEVVRDLAPSGRVVVNTGDALIDLCAAGLGVAWMCDFMRQPQSGELCEILSHTACESIPVVALALPTRQTLPKVRHLVDMVAAELAKRGVDEP